MGGNIRQLRNGFLYKIVALGGIDAAIHERGLERLVGCFELPVPSEQPNRT